MNVVSSLGVDRVSQVSTDELQFILGTVHVDFVPQVIWTESHPMTQT